jgi:hypothetical protein
MIDDRVNHRCRFSGSTGDLVSTIEDDSGGKPPGNPFDTAAINPAPEDTGPEAAEDRQNPVPETVENREMETGQAVIMSRPGQETRRLASPYPSQAGNRGTSRTWYGR